MNCTAPVHPLIQLAHGGTWFEILDNISSNKFHIRDSLLQSRLLNRSCQSFINLSLPENPSTSLTISPNLTMYPCYKGAHEEDMRERFLSYNCTGITVFYRDPANNSVVDESLHSDKCWKIQLPMNPNQHNSSDLFGMLTANFTMEWNISDDCMSCHESGGQCDTNSMNAFRCSLEESKRSRINKVILAIAICGGVLFLMCLLVPVLLWLCKKRIKDSYLLSRNTSSDPSSSKSDIEDIGGSFYYGIPLFSNDELEEASHSFDPSKELGDGGFGTVYHGSRSRIDSVRLALAICGGVLILVFVIVSVVLWLCKKRIKDLYLRSRKKSSEPSPSKPGITDNGGSFYYNISIFSSNELEEATDNFDPSKELGDGGFGTVYHGILKDGREVAIKRLYEKNYKRVEQFMNEIKILTCLKHQNLVTLYGCTSRRSRELLLVYEYIPNGTVADHIHGDRAKETTLPWSIRMNIAIETASALAYLHKSDIVHRDVKTNNILLDNNFCVKVADFGLSRLFPTDVTHISTAPQGTPGYVDPEYHQCYQLTEKSDVYSFGVVLVELISSMPAVDITRHKYEINLANLALNRIQNCAFDDLIDSSLGYKTDAEIMRMTTSVAELAFQCLQLEKDMRPSMHEVLVFLKEFKKGSAGKIPPSPETDEVGLLENKELQSSPVAVTDAWNSGSTTSSIV